jgi:SNF2 family DNA or RNA helicase
MDGYMRRYGIWLDGHYAPDRGSLDKQPHQEEALRWLLTREESANRGGILADEMGLGKTYEIMGLMVAKPMPNPTLIIVPPALLEQWRVCLIKYVSGTRGLHVFHGRGAKVDSLPNVPYMLTTYMMVGKLCDKLDIEWSRIIFDEAHHLRNSNTRIYREARRLRSSLKWGATGTPIQNRLGDLYSLCSILSVPCDITQRGEFMLRRTKATVGLKLPAVEMRDVIVSWKTEDELEFAREIHELVPLVAPDGSNVDTIIQDLTSLNWNSLVALLRARQVCIDPQMLSGVLEDHMDDLAMEQLSSSKIDAVVAQVSEKNGSNKLVFCHFRAEIDILAERLRAMGLSVGVIDGRVAKGKRKKILAAGDFLGAKLFDEIFAPQLNRYRSHGTDWLHQSVNEYLGAMDVLIVQIQTACEGLNLQQYQEVHFVSPHWNPAVEDQAIARCHRMGQTQPVRVFRYIMDTVSNQSFEQYCRSVQDAKREIMQLIE